MEKDFKSYFEEQRRECGERLKYERARLGFGLSEFAARVGVHRNTQRNYESGAREPDAKYCHAAAAVGVDITFVLSGISVSGLPGMAGQIAKLVFSRRDAGVSPDAMQALFYLLSLNNILEVIPDDDILLTEEHVNELIKITFERGDVFAEAFSAVSSYFFGVLKPTPDAFDNCRLWVDLIFETVSLYDSIKDSLHLSLRDSIRLSAEGILTRRKATTNPG
jgi:transcriptional regulator with XRE-family HTH domain